MRKRTQVKLNLVVHTVTWRKVIFFGPCFLKAKLNLYVLCTEILLLLFLSYR